MKAIGTPLFEPLESRRHCALLFLSFKLLDGLGRGELQNSTPQLITTAPVAGGRALRNAKFGIRIKPVTFVTSLGAFKRGASGLLPHVWDQIPQELLQLGADKGWRKIHKRCKKIIMNINN